MVGRVIPEVVSLFLLEFLIIVLWVVVRNRKLREKIDGLKNNALTMTPGDFFRFRNTRAGGHGRKVASIYNFPGVYVLYNKTKNMYYVGQGKKILDRVNAHFTGHGNGDVYVDYRNGDEFEISMIALANSGYNSLNELERLTIQRYNAYAKGYNRTRGNRG